MSQVVLIKGAGDIATGIACRLFRCGFTIIMTELTHPTVIRRTVAFAEAIYAGRAEVEGITAVKTDFADIKVTLLAGLIPGNNLLNINKLTNELKYRYERGDHMKSKPKPKAKINKPVDAMELVSVRRQWNSWEIAQVYVSEVSNPLWDLVSGGVKESSPEAFIFGYIWCDAIVSGSVAHSCLHGTAPHSIKICILKKDNPPRIYNHFLALVGPKPPYWQR